ncbi:OsmC family protein [Nodosilinea sp. LEGE 07298]|uniref:OsmC family protein n=1 Tax=Nodosilinea sp. LEGE 07298 TaxID=2777970 RepID=UPI001881D57F|nr:OsmC family protein [Nodosilinea sp. LEGE 07298]MBE9109860.1 OsmC family protein [Nodosilinea sp. LEGE 07298]
MASVQVSSNDSRFGQDIAIRQFQLTADEPTSLGGNDQGPTPTELVMAGLGSCKAITIQMYAERKDWSLDRVSVAVEPQTVDRQTVILAHLTLEGDLSDEQRDRLREIGDRCPVHRLLAGTVDIQTRFAASYQAVSCTYYDELEALATLKKIGQVIYRTEAGAEISREGRIVDFFSLAKVEFLKLEDGTAIRLDRLIEVDGKPVRFSDS